MLRFILRLHLLLSRLILVFISAILGVAPIMAGEAASPIEVPVWPGVCPGEICTEAESDLTARNDGVRRTTNVSRPSITVYPAPDSGQPAAAVLICPGGGYNYLAINKEGTEIATWLNSLGITGVVLKYRVPRNKAGALQDAQRALALVRSRATEWRIDPGRLGVMGFSAGGHLATRVAALGGERSYPSGDEVDHQSSRADFAVLIYPAYLQNKDGGLAEEFSAPGLCPPIFIAVTQDDRRFMDGCLAFYGALSRADVRADLHVFTEGGHAWGLRQRTLPVRLWPELCAAWLTSLKPPTVHGTETTP